MKKRSLSFCLTGLVVGPVVLSRLSAWMPHTVYVPVTAAYADASKATKNIAGAGLFKNYRKWRRVNDRPVYVDSAIASLCRAPTPAEQKVEFENPDPHAGKYIVVYVNKIGEKAMFNDKRKAFPAGTIIVKEKLPSEKSKKPELLTAMIKHKAGYNKGHGDWEYFALSGDATKVSARGKLEKCQNCHTSVQESDYVYGGYVSQAK